MWQKLLKYLRHSPPKARTSTPQRAPMEPGAPLGLGEMDTFSTHRPQMSTPGQPRTHKLTKPASTITQDGTPSYGLDEGQINTAFSGAANTIPNDLFDWYTSQAFIGYQACSLVSQNWLINNALSIPAHDAARVGFGIRKSDGDELHIKICHAIEKGDKKYRLQKNIIDFATNVRRFGHRLVLFCVESEDDGYYFKPFNIDGVRPGSYRGMSQIDPDWVAPVLDGQASSNPASRDFYEPTWWQINGHRYHKSHFVLERYAELPDVLKPNYFYGGLPLSQLILERVYAAERSANEVPMLLQSKRLNILHTNLDNDAANPQLIEQKLAKFAAFRNNYGVRVVAHEDVVEQLETTLVGLSDTVMLQYELVAAVAGMPSTKLLGTSPGGLDSSGSYEQSGYYDTLQTIQVQQESVIDRHHEIMIKSDIAPRFKVPYFEVTIDWLALHTPTAKERAEINLINRQAEMQAMTAGSVLGDEVRDKLIQDPFSGFEGLGSFTEGPQNDERDDTRVDDGEV